MTTRDVTEPARVESRPARIITEIFGPFHLVIPLPAVAGWHQTWPSLTGLWWGLFAAMFGGVPSYALVLWRVRTGLAGDRHITRREQRLVPLVLSLAMVLGGLVVLVVADAPAVVLAVQVTLLALGVVMLPITRVWKISFHTGVAAAVVVVLANVLPAVPVYVVGVTLVGLIGWARVRLGDHTPAQTVAGVVAGVGATWITLAAFLP
jgi:membrane-associated phospholipid phosphatase